eukprot:TRINITY_DN255_c0_g1_i2.p1 TRINITY_DN255_c0_g1~~TRINITY_DN255_c0_g1_i2.p1  ORF type:complete len:485 (-),score=232.46 TRINITY_DN255_c0_g1_i2:77-1441(-)
MTATDVATAAPKAQDGKSCPNSKEASPVKVKTPAEVQEEATTCLVTGKRHLLVSDVPAAVTILAKACELLSAQFGETAKECAESYFYYGKALLELSRLESGVLGNALDGVPEEDDEANNSKIEDPAKMTADEKNEVEEKVGEALEENFVSLEKKEEEKAEKEKKEEIDEAVEKKVESKEGEKKEEELEEGEASGSKEETEDEGMEEGDDSQEEEGEGDQDEEMDADKSTSETAAGEKEEKKEGEEEEEPSNLQLAWEMLELAKVVYTKQIETGAENKSEMEEKLCSSILALGEVSIENENYSQAVEDIKLCLEKQKNLPKDSRIIAETHYQLGVAQGFNAQYDEAVESLNSAIKIIKEKTKNMKEEHKSPSDDQKKEIAELEALVPEIEEKIADTKDMKKEAESKPKEGEAGFDASAKGDEKSVSSIAVKRKAEDDSSKNKKVASETEKTAAAV